MATLLARFRVGSFDIAAVSDGASMHDTEPWFPGVPAPEWMRATGVTDAEVKLPVNFGSFLVRGNGHTTLVDTGNGERTRGQHEGAAGLLDRLAELGVAPAEVDAVLLTHFHGDHVGWNVLRDAGPITFPNATYFLHEADVAYLTGADAPDAPGVRVSRSRVLPVRDAGQLEVFGAEFSPRRGITMLPTPGHTPGHCSVLLSSGGEGLVIVGDVAPHTTHLEHPEWVTRFDMDGPRAVASRRALAERAIAEGALVTGGHFPILTVGRLARAGGGYRWEAVEVERVAAGAR